MSQPPVSDAECLAAVEAVRQHGSKREAAKATGWSESQIRSRLEAAIRRKLVTQEEIRTPYSNLSEELLRRAVAAHRRHGSIAAASRELDVARTTFQYYLKQAAKRGLMGTEPVMPGYEIAKVSTTLDANGNKVRESIQQKPEAGDQFTVPEGHRIKGVSALVQDGRTVQQWVKTREGERDPEWVAEQVLAALKEDIPRADPVTAPVDLNDDLLNQYTITDLHLAALAWAEETGDEDYDLAIAEKLVIDWFAAAIRQSPDAATAVLAQLGDFLHHDSHLSITPTHGHVLDADSRFQKIVRAAIRITRQIVQMLLEKHGRVHVIMADDNHAPASAAWLREMFAAFYEDEPRITVDSHAGTYYAYEHGETALFYHHGHKRGIKDIDSVFAGKFREIYGRTKHAYGHIGHLHSDELKTTNLMKIERHETLAAPDAFNANAGYPANRSAKVITYSKRFGEVGRQIITPQMVAA